MVPQNMGRSKFHVTAADTKFISHLVHQFFVKNGSSLPSGNAMEQGRPPVAHMIHSDDDDDDGLESHKDKLASSSEESGSSSDEEDSLSSADSTRASHTGNRQRGRSSFSPSPDWATEDDAGSSDAPKRRGPGRPRKHQGKSDAPDKRGHEPWSVEEEALIRETMAMQLQMKGNLGFSRKTAMKLLEVFPRRTTSAIKNKWLGLKLKDIWGDWGEAEGKVQARDAKGKVRIEDPDPRKHYEGDSGSMTVYNDADEDRFDDSEVKPGSHEMNSWIKNRWTPEQDRLLTKRMHSEMQSAGVATMSVPKTVMKELGRSFGRKEKSISRRWSYLSGNSTWGGSDKRKKTKRVVGSILARIEPQGEESAPASQQAREDRPTKENRLLQWSPQEIETLDRLTKGIDKAADIDFKEILHQMPDPSRRTVAGCNVFWRRHIQPSRIPRGRLSTEKYVHISRRQSTAFQSVLTQLLSPYLQTRIRSMTMKHWGRVQIPAANLTFPNNRRKARREAPSPVATLNLPNIPRKPKGARKASSSNLRQSKILHIDLAGGPARKTISCGVWPGRAFHGVPLQLRYLTAAKALASCATAFTLSRCPSTRRDSKVSQVSAIHPLLSAHPCADGENLAPVLGADVRSHGCKLGLFADVPTPGGMRSWIATRLRKETRSSRWPGEPSTHGNRVTRVRNGPLLVGRSMAVQTLNLPSTDVTTMMIQR